LGSTVGLDPREDAEAALHEQRVRIERCGGAHVEANLNLGSDAGISLSTMIADVL